ncbi:MBL fold metallo-hydrolase [Brucepastera parasyntrophica]|uniref:MBL fold metallo-hydrolase n=1 Tax=Brucepastera parasyntrophica TaxID=2880008 RepID=UPI00210C2F84|nr:MBL fold metallo-hydrolase [Brucepastera parasyntrophica]ULQ60981.1 MBL fold metallo-hydrolase [Brucepastera parasyntrophica]
MKIKTFLFLGAVYCAVLLASCAGAGKNGVADKNVSTRQTGNVKVHTYSAGGANAVVVENTKLVIFDSFGGSDANTGFKAFVTSLNKPIDRVFISHSDDHHWLGIDELFPNTDLYSVDAAAIKQNPQGAALPVIGLADGNLTVDGVTYEFVTYRDLGSWVIKLPAQKIAMVHHLGYAEFHVPLPPLDTRLDILKGLEKEGYTWFIGGMAHPWQPGNSFPRSKNIITS